MDHDKVSNKDKVRRKSNSNSNNKGKGKGKGSNNDKDNYKNKEPSSLATGTGVVHGDANSKINLKALIVYSNENENNLDNFIKNLKIELHKQEKIKLGALKLLKTSTLTNKTKIKANNEIIEANEIIFETEKKLESLSRLQQIGFSDSGNKLTKTETDSNIDVDDFLQISIDEFKALIDNETDVNKKIQGCNKLIDIIKKAHTGSLTVKIIVKQILKLLLSENPNLIGCGYKLIRYLLSSNNVSDDFKTLKKIHLNYFIILTIISEHDRSNSSSSNGDSINSRVKIFECLKLIRKIIEINTEFLSISLIKLIINLFETLSNENNFYLRLVLIETLCEISLLECELAFKSNCIKLIIQSSIENFSHDSKNLINKISLNCLLKLIELPQFKKFIIIEEFLPNLLANLMEFNTHIKLEKLHNIGIILIKLFKNWNGLSLFLENDYKFLKQLINCLTIDLIYIKKFVLQIFLHILRIKKLPWLEENDSNNDNKKIDGNGSKDSHINNSDSDKDVSFKRSLPELENSIINQLTSIILTSLLKNGLIEVLNMNLEKFYLNKSYKKLNKKIIILLSEIIYLKNFLIPKDALDDFKISFKLNRLIEKEIRKHNETKKITYSANYTQLNTVSVDKIFQNLQFKNSYEKNSLISLINKRNYEAFFRNNVEVDFEVDIKNLIFQTHVLTTKEFKDWDWLLIKELINGPLKNFKKFEEVLKNTKFFKRLLSFYKPYKFRFSKLKNTAKNKQIFIEIGDLIFKSLMSFRIGIRFLLENKILIEIFENFRQINNGIFNKKNLEVTINKYYFKFLSNLTRKADGILILKSLSFLNIFYQVSNRETNRDDLIKLMLDEFNFKLSNELRVLLIKISTTSSISIRLISIKKIEALLVEESESHSIDNGFEKLLVNLLINLLYDRDIRIIQDSIEILNNYAIDESKIEIILLFKPNFENLGPFGVKLIKKLMNFPNGFKYLVENNNNFIENQLENFIENKNKFFLRSIESNYYKIIESDSIINDENEKFEDNENNGNYEFNFFKFLVKTEDGFKIFLKTGIFNNFLTTINNYIDIIKNDNELGFYEHNSSAEINDLLNELKSSLFCIGYICNTNNDSNLIFLELNEIIEKLYFILKYSINWNLKGICVNVLNLICKKNQGRDFLDEFKISTTESFMKNLRVCYFSDESIFNFRFIVEAEHKYEQQEQIDEDGNGNGKGNIFEKIMERICQDEDEEREELDMDSVDNTSIDDTSDANNPTEVYLVSNNNDYITGLIGNRKIFSNYFSKEYILLYEVFENLNLIIIQQSKAIVNLNKLKLRNSLFFGKNSNKLVLVNFFLLNLQFFKFKFSSIKFFLVDFLNLDKILRFKFCGEDDKGEKGKK